MNSDVKVSVTETPMEKRHIWYAATGLVLGAVITGVAAATEVNSQNSGLMRMMGMKSETNAPSAMFGMSHDMMDGSGDMSGMSMNAMVSLSLIFRPIG